MGKFWITPFGERSWNAVGNSEPNGIPDVILFGLRSIRSVRSSYPLLIGFYFQTIDFT